MSARRREVLAAIAWVVLVAGAVAGGTDLRTSRPEIKVRAAPFMGRWDLDVARPGSLLLAAALGLAVVVVGPRLARRLPWTRLLAVLGVVAAGWLLLLNAVDGPGALEEPLRSEHEYLAGVVDVDAAGGAGPFLDAFTDDIAAYPIHVQGHPPGLVVALWAVDDSGLDAEDASVAAIVGAWALAAVVVAAALRATAGEAVARRAVPFLALVPGAVWAGTSFDALFCGVVALGAGLVVVGTCAEGRRRQVALAVAGGVLVATAMLLSYSVVPVLAVPVAAAVAARRAVPLVVAGATSALVLLVVGLASGFWWPAGLAATREQYHLGVAADRPFSYFVVGNLAAVAVAAGPAVAVALAGAGRRLLDGGAVVLGAVVAVAAADLSGLSKAEVERIWLPFVPWLVAATAFAPDGGHRRRLALAAQVAVALVAQVALRSPW